MPDIHALAEAPVEEPHALPHPFALMALALGMIGMTLTLSAWAAEAGPTPQRATQLAYMVRQDCGSCHGMTLGGGLGPPLLPATLAQKPMAYLKAVILNGSAGSAMPGWSPLLSEADADWIAANLLRGFPDAR